MKEKRHKKKDKKTHKRKSKRDEKSDRQRNVIIMLMLQIAISINNQTFNICIF